MSGRNSTQKEDARLAQYIAEALPGPVGRSGNKIYKALVEDPDKWPWAKTRSWQGWRERYMKNKAEFDHRIRRLQRLAGKEPDEVAADLDRKLSQKNPFTDDEDRLLTKYLARYNPRMKGRNGNEVYKRLVENAEGKWNWSSRHTWHSWRHRYVSNHDHFDKEIRKYQQRHGIEVPPEGPLPMGLERPRKRPKVMEVDSQEEQWARINWESPRKGDALKVNGPNASEDKKHIVVEEERKETSTAVQNQSNTDDDESDDPSGENEKPPDSEDYHGEIFETSEKDEGMGSDDRQTSGDQDDYNHVVEKVGGGQGKQANILENQHSEVVIKKESEERQLNVQSDLQSHIKAERVSPQSIPHAQLSSNPTTGGYQNNLPRSSQPRRKKLNIDDDPFQDSEPSPQNSRQIPVKKKRVPNFIGGAFVSSLNGRRRKRAQESSTEESDAAAVWPPVRAKGATRSQDKDGTVEGIDEDATATRKPREQSGKGKARDHGQSTAIALGTASSKPVKKTYSVPSHSASQQRQQPTKHPQDANMVQAQDTPGAGPSRVTAVKTDVFVQPPMAIPKRYSTGDIVDSTPTNDHAVDQTHSTGSRTINLRQELANKQLQLVQRPLARVSRASSALSEEDQQLVQQLGIQQAARMLSEEFGFTEVVVQKLWRELLSLRLVRDVLVEMRNAADRAMNDWVEASSSISGRNTSDTPSTATSTMSIVKSRLPSVVNSASKVRASSASVNGAGGGGGRKSLDIRPVDGRDAMDLDYEPLTGTRAGKYARLAKMGREDEALEREQRRVSSIALSPRRDDLQQQSQLQQENDSSPEKKATEEREDARGSDPHESDASEGGSEDETDQVDERSEDDVSDEEQESDHGDRRDEDEGGAMQVDSPKSPTMGTEEKDEAAGHSKTEPSRDAGPITESVPGRSSGTTEAENDQRSGNDTRDENGDVSITSESSEVIEVEEIVQSERERWKEVDQLFWAANRQNVEMLREVEKSFSPEFLMDWLSTKVVLK